MRKVIACCPMNAKSHTGHGDVIVQEKQQSTKKWQNALSTGDRMAYIKFTDTDL